MPMLTLAAHAQAGKKLLVLGLGRTGMATAEALAAGGADVTVWDDSKPIAISGCRLANPLEIGMDGFDGLVLSPGIPFTHPEPHPAVKLAQTLSIPVIGDTELLFTEHPNAPFIAITGTNGKSTVTALTAHIFASAGVKAGAGGNLGTPVFAIQRDEQAPYILELSSYQLDLCASTKFNVAALLNLSADHLDRHGNLQGYIQAKLRIFDRQTLNDFAFISVDDEYCKSVASALERSGQHHVVKVSATTTLADGISAKDGLLRFGDTLKPIFDLTSLSRTLPGQHNWQNAAFAAGMARAMGLRQDQIIAGLKTFRGLAHRQELIAETVDGLRFINDSKATNAEATSKALKAFDDIYWIAGGQAKHDGIGPLLNMLGAVKGVYLIGEAQELFAKTLSKEAPKDMPSHKCGTLEKAVSLAVEHARLSGGGTILLSPACASWDQFASFEDRGEAFSKILDTLI